MSSGFEHEHLPKVSLNLENFSVDLVASLAETLEQVVGLTDAQGFISVVGNKIGLSIDNEYRSALAVDKLTKEQVSVVLVDLKDRIKGQFYIVEQSDDRIVLRNNRCPFGDKVLGNSSLCMMTTNVFGTIAARNLGYSRITVNQAIARGDQQCEVVIDLSQPSSREHHGGTEFFGERINNPG